MDISSVYKNRPYLFEIEGQPIEHLDPLLKAIFEKAKIDLKKNQIKKTVYTDFYDLVIVGDFVIKFSLDPSNGALENEAEALKQMGKPLISIGSFRYGDEISYSVNNRAKGEEISSVGVGVILPKIDQFCSLFKEQLNKQTKQSFKKNLMTFLSEEVNLSSLPTETLEVIQDLDSIKNIFKSIESEMLQISSMVNNDRKFLCHGNLSLDNILVKDDGFQFINWEKSFVGNPYLDLASFIIFSGFSEETEKKIFDNFCQIIEEKDLNQGWKEYKVCFEFCLRKCLLILFMSYLKEVYLFNSSNPLKILNNIQTFIKNHKRFLKVPSVYSNYEAIYSFMLSPVVGRQ